MTPETVPISPEQLKELANDHPRFYTDLIATSLPDPNRFGHRLIAQKDLDQLKAHHGPAPTGLPGLAEMAANFTRAIAKWVRHGFCAVTRERFQERLAICRQCPHWSGRRCRKCGCTGIKLWLSTEKCPIGRWN